MATVGMGVIELVTGSEGKHAARGKALADLVMGQCVQVDGTALTDTRFDFGVEEAANGDECFAIVLDESALTGQAVDVLIRGEIEGFTGLTPGTYLSVVGGFLDSTAPTTLRQFYVLTPTRVLKRY